MRRLWVTVLLGAGLVGQAGASPAETSADALATASLLHTAENLYYLPEAPARAGRLVALGGFLQQLAPENPRALRFLADLYHTRGQYDRAVRAEKQLLQANPDDFGAQQRWFRFSLSQLNRAKARLGFCKSVVQSDALSAALRAEAACERARVFAGQADRDDARKAIETALQRDPLNRTALISRLEFTDEPPTDLKARTMVSLLRGNPRAWWVGVELASLAGQVGLHDQAVTLYEWAWTVRAGRRPPSDAPADFAEGYVSALLDAGRAAQAVKLFGPAIERLGEAPEFQALMVEAYRRVGQSPRAEKLLARLEVRYRASLEALENASQPQDPRQQARRQEQTARAAVDLAWFNLLAYDRPLKALQFIRKAQQLGAGGKAVRLVTAAADLAAGKNEGTKVLRSLLEDEPLAAYFLASYEYDSGRVTEAEQDLLAGLKLGRRDLAFRKLRDLAERHQVSVPAMPEAPTVQSFLNELMPTVLQMGTRPGTFFEVRIEPQPAQVPLGKPLWVAATLRNTAEVPLSVGEWGLLDRRVGLVVHLTDRQGNDVFQTVPVIVWPAPKYLPPGQSVTGRVRIDVGGIARWLARRPLATVDLTVLGLVSPYEAGTRVVSALPDVEPARTQLRRLGLGTSEPAAARIGPQQTPQQYRQALRQIERTLHDGALAERMHSARQVGSLLSWLGEVRAGRETLPASLARDVSEPVVLGLMGKALADKSPVVRAEMLASLAWAELNGAMLNQIGAVVEDPSPLVRFRTVELLGASPLKANDKLIALYTRDSDERVALLARAFQAARQQPATAPAATGQGARP